MSIWLVEQLRLTVFPGGPVEPLTEEWWKSVVEAPPDEYRARPSQGTSTATGPLVRENLTSALLELDLAPGRIDWLLQSSGELDNAGMEGLPTIGRVADVLPLFAAMVGPWLLGFGEPLQRVALGAIVHQSVASRRAGYEVLAPLIPSVTLEPDAVSDLIFQINRPRPSTTYPGIVLNRMGHWSVMRWQLIQASILIPSGGAQIGESSHGLSVRLQSEMNTDAPLPDGVDQLDPSLLASLFDELRSGLDSTIREGDIS